MQINQAVAKACGIALLGLCSINGYAASITGQVNLNASVGVSAFSIDFYSNTAQACGIASPGSPGCFGINNPIDGSFNNLLLGYQAGNTIKDLSGPPITGNISLSQFVQFANGITFDLTKILPGTGPVCNAALGNTPGYTCTPTVTVGANTFLSPFTLQNSGAGPNGTATNAAVSFNVEVLGYLGLASTGTSTYNGAFSTQSAGMNIAGVLATVGNGGTVVASYSGNFNGAPNVTNPVPEPGTLGTLGIGLAALVFGAIRRKSGSDS